MSLDHLDFAMKLTNLSLSFRVFLFRNCNWDIFTDVTIPPAAILHWQKGSEQSDTVLETEYYL